MITNFKIFENIKFNIGDEVYLLKVAYDTRLLAYPKPIKIIKISDDRYITDLYPNVSIHPGNLILSDEYEMKQNIKKYNM